MNSLALITIIEHRRQSLEVCKKLIATGQTEQANVILQLLEENINQTLKEVIA